MLFLSDNSNSKTYIQRYLNTIFGLADSYRRNNMLDSASFYNIIGYKQSIKLKKKKKKYLFVLSESATQYDKENFKITIDSLQRYKDSIIKYISKSNITILYFYLGNSYYRQNKNKKGVKYLVKMDSIIQKSTYLLDVERNGYLTLIDFYKNTKNINEQLLYTKKLIKIDSILMKNYKVLNQNIISKYDNPKLLLSKDKLIKSLNKKSRQSKYDIYTLIVLLLIILSFSLVYFIKQRNYKNRFNLLVLEIEDKKNNRRNLLISEEKAVPILGQLELFELEKGFLEIKLTQTNLAKRLNTNSTYLSKVINQYKNTNFSTYINNLRVDYAIKKLKEDKKLYLLSIDGMSNEFGFNNSETFSKAFYKKTGIYPSYFIKRIENNNK